MYFINAKRSLSLDKKLENCSFPLLLNDNSNYYELQGTWLQIEYCTKYFNI